MKKRILLLALLTALLLSGCAMRTVEEMYTPPKRSEEYKELQAAIDMAMYGLTFSSPQSGENQQTVQMADLSGDGTLEYIVFARDPANKSIRILVFDQTGENFQLIENDIIGMTSDVLEGNFKIFIGKKSDLNKIDKVMKKTNVSAHKKYFTAETTAKAVLTEAEMENGVALIDFGGGSTSVTIYHGNIMRHYASIPFGGKNITDDIKSECQISERLAENIKLAYGACMPEKLQSLSEKVLHIRSNNAEPDKQVTVKYLSEIITARIEEIMMAMLYEIDESGFADMLRSGIVITGGCAQTANLGSFIYELSGYRVRTGYPQARISVSGCDGIKDTTAATSLGLIMAAKEEQCIVNCAVPRNEGNCEGLVIETADENPEEGNIWTITEPEIPQEPEPESEPAEGELFADEQIEKVIPEKKQKKSIFNVLWTKAKKVTEEAKEKTGKLLDEISEEEV